FHPQVQQFAGGKWKCEADVEFVLLNKATNYSSKRHFTWDDGKPIRGMNGTHYFSDLTNSKYGYINNNKIILEFRVNDISVEGIDPTPILDLSKFSSPIELNNVTLLIGEQSLCVSKDYLAVHSPVFAAMFFGKFVENGK
ncbi:hypothetical protein PENTCL1PPCAC_1294, partial [Pristionchus entomophagus]